MIGGGKLKKWKIVVFIVILILIVCNMSYSYLTPNIVSIVNPKIISKGEVKKEKVVALTFDDGPDPIYTKEAIKILKRYDVKATFFVVGEMVERYPNIVKEQSRLGHEIENHTYTHPNLEKVDGIETIKEIINAQESIEKITLRKPVFFRPPKGLFNKETADIVEIYGYKTVLWSVCVEHKASVTPQKMAQRVISKARPGLIILAHDGRLDRSKTIKALPIIIQGYKKLGYKFVTLEELLNKDKNPY